jgi:hypothetical protein
VRIAPVVLDLGFQPNLSVYLRASVLSLSRVLRQLRAALQLDLHPELDDSFGGNLEEGVRAHGISRNEHEQPLTP